MKFRTFTALRHRNFRLFFFGQSVSLIGTWMHSTAQGWLVLKLTDSAFYLSLVHAMGYWPLLFFAPIGGVAADRGSKRNMLIITQSLSMALALILAVLVSLGVVQAWHVALVALGLGIVNTFDIPARQAFIFDMVGKEDLTNGIALNASLFHGARVVGPAVAGFIIGIAGMAVCFYVNALSYITIIAGLYMMKVAPPETVRERRPMLKEIREGMGFVRRSPVIRAFMLMASFSSLLVIPYIALMPIYARDVLKIGAAGLGLLMGSAGVGALAGALTLASTGTFERRGRASFVSGILSNTAVLAFSFSRSTTLSCALLMVAGWGMIVQMATVNAIIQVEAPDALRGRVMSLYTTVFLGLIPVGNLMVGALATWVGAPHAVALSATAALIAYAFLAMFNKTMMSH
ncbi:MAG TPA: MFS transporter [Nitrospirota bacterium]|jgi:MFS family permease